jgi:hypothetical protein
MHSAAVNLLGTFWIRHHTTIHQYTLFYSKRPLICKFKFFPSLSSEIQQMPWQICKPFTTTCKLRTSRMMKSSYDYKSNIKNFYPQRWFVVMRWLVVGPKGLRWLCCALGGWSEVCPRWLRGGWVSLKWVQGSWGVLKVDLWLLRYVRGSWDIPGISLRWLRYVRYMSEICLGEMGWARAGCGVL